MDDTCFILNREKANCFVEKIIPDNKIVQVTQITLALRRSQINNICKYQMKLRSQMKSNASTQMKFDVTRKKCLFLQFCE